MKTGRADLDAMIRVASIPSDEPTFLLRAQDDQAAQTVRCWAQLQLTAGAPVAVVEQALKQADAMDAWPVKKQPDAGHLTPERAKGLAYEFSRREWNLGAGSPTAIAEARGAAERTAELQKLVDFVGMIATLRDAVMVGTQAELALDVLRTVAAQWVEYAAERGIVAQPEGFEPTQAGA